MIDNSISFDAKQTNLINLLKASIKILIGNSVASSSINHNLSIKFNPTFQQYVDTSCSSRMFIGIFPLLMPENQYLLKCDHKYSWALQNKRHITANNLNNFHQIMNVDEGWFKNNENRLNFCTPKCVETCWTWSPRRSTGDQHFDWCKLSWKYSPCRSMYFHQWKHDIQKWLMYLDGGGWDVQKWSMPMMSKIMVLKNWSMWVDKIPVSEVAVFESNQLRMIKCSSACWTARGLMMIGSLMMIKIINNIER